MKENIISSFIQSEPLNEKQSMKKKFLQCKYIYFYIFCFGIYTTTLQKLRKTFFIIKTMFEGLCVILFISPMKIMPPFKIYI